MLKYRAVRNGTPIHDQSSLCRSCRHAAIVSGFAESQQLIFCNEVGWKDEVVPWNIYECSRYDNRSQPALRVMREIAWTIRTDASGKKMGFVAPKDQNDQERRNPLLNPFSGEEEY